MSYTAQPSPTPTGSYVQGSVSPQPAPAPSAIPSSGDAWNTQWNQIWNQAYNSGYNMGTRPSVDSSFNSAVDQGYQAGLSARPAVDGGYQTSGTNQVLGVSSQPSSPTPDFNGMVASADEINQAYQPQIDYLSAQENALTASQPGYQKAIQDQAELSKQKLEAQKLNALNVYGNQETSLNETKESAIASARRLYSDLSRRGNNRFSADSSTGRYYSEILGRSVQESMSNADKEAIRGFVLLGQARRQLETEVALSTKEIETNTSEAIRLLKEKWESDVREINANRQMLESQKAEAKLQALRDSRSMMYNYESQAEVYRQQLNLYKIQQNAGFDSLEANLTKSTTATGASTDSAGNAISKINEPTKTAFSAVAPTVAYNSNPLSKYTGIINQYDKESDPYASLNPFAIA